MKIQRSISIVLTVLVLFIFGSACSSPEPPPNPAPPPISTETSEANPAAIPTEFELVTTCFANTAEAYFQNRNQEGLGGTANGLLLAAQREKENLCDPNSTNLPPKLTISNCSDRFELSLSYDFFGADEVFDKEGNLLFGLAGSETNSFCGQTAFEAKFGEKPIIYDQCKTVRPNICDQNFDELLFLFSENRFDELFEAVQVEESNDWRDVGELDAQTKACVAPTAEEFYQERQAEFGGSGGEFSQGSLLNVLSKLPYGDCTEPSGGFPINKVTQCQGAIAFSNSGGYTTENEFFSNQTGELVFASVATDFNAFCKNASFDVSFGNMPTQACKTTTVSYCNITQDMIMSLYNSGDYEQIVPAILVAQE